MGQPSAWSFFHEPAMLMHAAITSKTCATSCVKCSWKPSNRELMNKPTLTVQVRGLTMSQLFHVKTATYHVLCCLWLLSSGACCIGWIFCCPLFCLGKCLREPSSLEDEEEDRNDPCIPWKYQIDGYPPGSSWTRRSGALSPLFLNWEGEQCVLGGRCGTMKSAASAIAAVFATSWGELIHSRISAACDPLQADLLGFR